MEWVEDCYGRIGRIDEHAKVVHWAYGTTRIPAEEKLTYFLDPARAERRFEVQRQEMWSDAVRLEPLSHQVLVKLGVARNTMRHDQLHCDVGVPTLCLAAVMWDESRSVPLEAYARRLLRNSYRRALRGSATSRRETSLAGLPSVKEQPDTRLSAQDPSVGLSAREELSALGLTSDELDILLLRYDSGESFDNIARALGLNSRSTPLHHLNKIMARCQKKARQTG